MYKLQTALNIGGRPVRINQFQTWIADQKRMVTKFVVIENGETILETYKTADVVQALADMLGGD